MGGLTNLCDIDPQTLNLDPTHCQLIMKATAVVATHVYGNPCDVRALFDFARSNNLRLIFDAAHAFGVEVDKRSVLSFGDASAISFHATKLFHTIEVELSSPKMMN